MAKLSANGRELLRLEFIGYRRAYMESGYILVNYGHGWTRDAKLKPGVDPVAYAESRRAKREELNRTRPCYAEYRDALVKAVRLEHRGKLNNAIDLLPGDPDGVWSECHEEMEIDQNMCADLCRLYAAAEAEAKALKPVATNHTFQVLDPA